MASPQLDNVKATEFTDKSSTGEMKSNFTKILPKAKLKMQRDRRFRRMYPVAGLPGWTREVVTRSKGARAGSVDIYYHPATDRKCRSKKEMQEVLGARMDLTNLVFKTGVFTNNLGKLSKIKTVKHMEFSICGGESAGVIFHILKPLCQNA